MDLRQLQSLVAIADHRTFSAAARALHTVQSNVSTHIARFERELGATLVDRSAGKLTTEGEVVVARARRVIAELNALSADVASITSEITGNAQLGTIGTTGRWLTPLLLDEMNERHPRVRIVVTEATTLSLLPLLFTDQIDLAIVNLPQRDPDLEITLLFEEDLVAVIPCDHPLADSERPVSFTDLAKHELLLGPRGSNLRGEVDLHATDAGATLTAAAEIDGVRLATTLAFQGYAPTITPMTAIPRWAEPSNWLMRPIAEEPRRFVGLAVRRRGMLSAPATAAREVLESLVREHIEDEPGLHLPTER
ncbi:MAG: LysR family transcriptional regulator [Actinomycetia bacterium]|nr:LysR family transcriptional regulator [Actinomycetes bacterium]MCP4962807.1 LysR family transcriptional regulator [Actinomycetes bacterium]